LHQKNAFCTQLLANNPALSDRFNFLQRCADMDHKYRFFAAFCRFIALQTCNCRLFASLFTMEQLKISDEADNQQRNAASQCKSAPQGAR